MSRAFLLAALALGSAPAFAQTDATAPSSASAAPSGDTEALKRDFDAKLEAARKEVKELREELRAQLATQSIASGWQEEWVEEKRKLELLTFDGYLRTRPDLFYKFDLGRGPDPAGYSLWPRSPVSSGLQSGERTQTGINMRFRFEPTLNISEEVRIRSQIDALDNVVWGSTPDYAFSRNASNGYAYDLNQYSIFSNSQVPPSAGINALNDSVRVKRLYGEISTPVGILRFGRMGSQWGLGMLHNDGTGIDNDYGDTVDRLMFVAEPVSGWYITPMVDVLVSGPTSLRQTAGGQPFDLSQSDTAMSYNIAIARRDTDSEARAKLDSGQSVLNYGIRFDWRTQKTDSIDVLSQPFTQEGEDPNSPTFQHVLRNTNLLMPDLWGKFERKNFRLEAEAAAVMGWMDNRALSAADAALAGVQSLNFWQFGGVVQGEYKFLNGDLEVGGEVGFASGDKKPGYGYFTRRKGSGPNGQTEYGDIDGSQVRCQQSSGGTICDSGGNIIRNFRFNPDYRVDMILYRELLGGITDSIYVKPRISWRITQGFHVFAAVIYSRAIYAESTPSAHVVNGTFSGSADLGLEANVGARYETEDGFFAILQYGGLIPLAGLGGVNPQNPSQPYQLDWAQALRANLGIRF
jgi:uncharacterized protein (TIGR04551 family)